MRRRAIGLIVWVLPVLLAACRPDMAAWTRHLAEPAVAKLDGAWTVELRADSGEYGHEAIRARTTGRVALVLNRGRVMTSWFGAPPVAFGTYNVPLDSLNIATGDAMGTPDIACGTTHQAEFFSSLPAYG